MEEVVRAAEVTKVYSMGEQRVEALKGVTLSVERSDFAAIMGASGSGKSTFMNILGCLDVPNKGEYILDGVNVGKLDKNQLARIRNEKIGFVFQGFNLLSRTSAIENVELPMLYNGHASKDRRQRARIALKNVGLEGREGHHPNQLSGGQQQRVAIARALAMDPKVLLLDEITSALDPELTGEVLKVVSDLAKEGMTMILVTHEIAFARDISDRVLFFESGCIVEEGDPETLFKNPSHERTKRFLANFRH